MTWGPMHSRHDARTLQFTVRNLLHTYYVFGPQFTMYIVTPGTRLYPAPYPSASPPAIHLLTSSTRPALIKSPFSTHLIMQPPPRASSSAPFIMSSFLCMITSFLAYRYYSGHPVGVFPALDFGTSLTTSYDSERSPQTRDHTPAATPPIFAGRTPPRTRNHIPPRADSSRPAVLSSGTTQTLLPVPRTTARVDLTLVSPLEPPRITASSTACLIDQSGHQTTRRRRR
ncbi:hypothetical protein HD554DRAFT_1163460 [Boletus coccyginus]|nr:hypothetical protein HD554DRAFT_1163460 [Boletus coccyginus]